MSESNFIENGRNNIIIENREKAIISGVTEVLAFDECQVSMDTVLGRLKIEGDGLHVEKLSLDIGEIALSGRIDGIEYMGKSKEKSFWSKIF